METDSNYLCRVCLEKGASVPIFETKGSVDPNVYFKLCQCLNETLEDIEGYPRHICQLCLITLNTATKFIEQYKVSTQVLQHHLQSSLDEWETVDSEYMVLDGTADEIYKLDVKKIKQEPQEPHERLVHDVLEPLLINKNITIRKETRPEANVKTVKKGVKQHTSPKLVDKIALRKTKGTALSTDSSKYKVRDVNKAERNKKKLKSPPLIYPPVPDYTDLPEEKNVLCYQCGETVKSSRLRYHIDSKHSSSDNKCPHCSKGIMGKDNLKVHIKLVHFSTPLSCSTCGKVLKNKKVLQTHIRQVHQGKSRTRRFICDICKQAFWSKAEMTMHIRSIHTGERPEVCSVCDKAFTHMRYLKEHMRLHTGEKPYKCPVCGKGHAGRANMKSHVKHNHRLSDLDDQTRAALSKCTSLMKHMKP